MEECKMMYKLKTRDMNDIKYVLNLCSYIDTGQPCSIFSINLIGFTTYGFYLSIVGLEFEDLEIIIDESKGIDISRLFKMNQCDYMKLELNNFYDMIYNRGYQCV